MAQNEKGGADLDIFEGLGKKAAPARSSSGTQPRSVPPPPPSLRPAESKRTLLGMTAPTPMPPPASNPPAGVAASSTPSRIPPPPPGRSSLPPVVAPSSASAKAAAPAPAPANLAETRPGGALGGPSGVDVDWDDEDEATQVFAEDATAIFAEDETKMLEEDKTRALPSGPAAFVAAPAPAPAAGMPDRPKATLLGLTAPVAPPSPMSRPAPRPLSTPPPPPPGGAFGRSGGFPGPSSYPPPPTINPSAAPPAAPTHKGLGGMPQWSTTPPPPVAPMPAPRRSSVPEYGTPPPRPIEETRLLPPNRLAGRSTQIAFASMFALVVILLLVFWPSKGRIIVNVMDSHGGSVNRLDLYVDGQKAKCDTAPCPLEESSGAHEVKVVADGYDVPAVQAVVVESRKDVTASFVLGSSRGTGIKAGGAQAGVKLFVDDKEIGPLPQEVRDLAPGDHVIRVAGSDRYQAMDKHVTVERDKVEDLGTITLKVLKGKVTVSLGTPGARVFIVSGADRRELPMLPISVDIDTTKSWSLEGTRPGFDDYRQLISFDDGQAERTYTVTLEPKSAASPVTALPPAYNPAPAYNPPAYNSNPAPAPAPRPAPAPAPVAQSDDSGGGGGGGGTEAFLNINSIPPSTCFLDGRSLGSTPRVHVSVKPGTHAVKFVDSDDGLTKTISVNVRAGETKPAVAKLN